MQNIYLNPKVARDARLATLLIVAGVALLCLDAGMFRLPWVPMLVFGRFGWLAGLALICYGGWLKGLAKRYQKYALLMAGEQNYSLPQMAALTGRGGAAFMKDLQAMARRGYISRGFLFGVDEKKEEKAAGPDAAEDPVLAQGRAFIARISVIEAQEPDEMIRAKIKDARVAATAIFEFVAERPDSARQLARFMEYQLPEAVKLLNTYRSVTNKDVVVSHMSEAAGAVEGVLDNIVAAMRAQLDDLYRDLAVNTKADADVFKNVTNTAGGDFH